MTAEEEACFQAKEHLDIVSLIFPLSPFVDGEGLDHLDRKVRLDG